MMKFRQYLLLIVLLPCPLLFGQVKNEREFRILKSQFPENALDLMADWTEDGRRIRYYKELDSNQTGYELKFKKKRLHYSVEFNEHGVLEDIEVLIKEVDLPKEVLSTIQTELKNKFGNYRIRRMQQQYPVREDEPVQNTIRSAFQNLLLPWIRYEIMVSAREEKSYKEFEALFDSEGNLLSVRASLPANYDHVLY